MKTGVVVLAAGAVWEPTTVAAIEKASGLVLLKRCVDVDDLLATCAAGQVDLVLVSLDSPGLDADAVTRVHAAGARVVGVSGALAEASRHRAQTIGMRNVITESEATEAATIVGLHRALPQHLVSDPEPVGEISTEPVVAVLGPAGAPGRTTVAINVAAALASRGSGGAYVTLIDADLSGASIGQRLAVTDEVSGLLVASRLPSTRLSEDWRSAALEIAPRLALVTGLPRPERRAEVAPEAVSALALAAATVGPVVIDCGGDLADESITSAVLATADVLIVVGLADPVGLTRLTRYVDELAQLTKAPTHVVINRFRSRLMANPAEIAELVNRPATIASYRMIPEDPGPADRALVHQRAVVEMAPNSASSRALVELALVVVPAQDRRPGARRLKRRGLRRRAS